VVASDWPMVDSSTRDATRHLSGDVLEDNKVMLGFAYSLGARSMPGTAGVDPVRLCLKV